MILLGAEDTVAGIAQTGNDVAVVVEMVNLALPPNPYCFIDGLIAKHTVFSVLLSSATTRFVFNGSNPLSRHSTEA